VQRGVLGSVMDLKALGCLAEAFAALAITEEQLRQTTVPVMAVKGGEEEVVLGGGDLKAALPGYQEIIIPGRNHRSVVLDADFQQAIVDFLLARSTQGNDRKV
jgi:pimeloyl-ACP methyl ester carboxylesterase